MGPEIALAPEFFDYAMRKVECVGLFVIALLLLLVLHKSNRSRLENLRKQLPKEDE